MTYGSLLGFSIGSCIHASPAFASILGDICSRASVGVYAGQTRKKIRQIANIPQNEHCDDCAIHMFCSPCAICEESIALEHYEKHGEIYGPVPTAPPEEMIMEKN